MDSRNTNRGASLARFLVVVCVLAIAAWLLLPKILDRARGREQWEFVMKWGSRGSADGQFRNPFGIAVDSSGNAYVTEQFKERIQKFDSSGKFLTKWGSRGSKDGEFKYPRGIAVGPHGNVYVADVRNHRIQEFDSSGKFLTNWGSEGPGDGEFKRPNGIAVDSSGNVFVVDEDNSRIQKFRWRR